MSLPSLGDEFDSRMTLQTDPERVSLMVKAPDFSREMQARLLHTLLFFLLVDKYEYAFTRNHKRES